MAPSRPAERPGIERGFALAGLAAFALAQPLLDLVGRYPPFLVAHDLEPGEVVAFALLLGLGLPAVAFAVGLATAALGRRLGGALFFLAAAALVAAFLLQLLRPDGWPRLGVAAAATLGAIAAAALLARPRAGGLFRLLAVAVPLFPLLFLLRPGIRPLAFPPRVVALGAAQPLATPPIVLLVFDELSLGTLLADEGGIDAVRFPSFARLAATASWYRQATTVAFATHLAVPAILTGVYPVENGGGTLAEQPDNLFTWLGQGYALQAFESMTRLCPRELCAGLERPDRRARLDAFAADLAIVARRRLLPEPFVADLPRVDADWGRFAGGGEASGRTLSRDDVPQIVARFLAGIQPSAKPVARVLHLNLPHLPWRYLPSGQSYGSSKRDLVPMGLHGEDWDPEPWPTVVAWQRHLLQSMYADAVLGRILDRLETTGLLDRALLVVTADHGVAFWPGESRREPDVRNRPDLLRIPLFVKLPGQRDARVDDGLAETVDVVPTIGAALGSAPGWKVDGRPLPLAPGARDRRAFETVKGSQALAALEVPAELPLAPTIARRLQLFGPSDDAERLYRLDAPQALWGRRVRRAPAAAGLRFEPFQPYAYRKVDPAGPFLPALVLGQLVFDEGRKPAPLELAVAVDGRVEALTRPFRNTRGRWQVNALVRPGAFRPGRNVVALYELVRDGDAFELRKVRTAAPPAG